MAEITMNYFSAMMARYVTFKVLLPFDTAPVMGGDQGPYKTLYFLNGYSSDAQSMVTQLTLASESMYKNLAIVVPSGENSFYVDQPLVNTFYEKFIVEELVDVTRKLLPLSTRREDTFIGGISMGGFGSLMLGARHMDRFSKIMAMSPAVNLYTLADEGLFREDMMDFYFKSRENFDKEYNPSTLLVQAKKEGKELPDLYMCCGLQDPLTYNVCKKFHEDMIEAGIPLETSYGDGVHDINYWNEHLSAAVDYILK